MIEKRSPSDTGEGRGERERVVWLAAHFDKGHWIAERADYDECTCGATFWRASGGDQGVREALRELVGAIRPDGYGSYCDSWALRAAIAKARALLTPPGEPE